MAVAHSTLTDEDVESAARLIAGRVRQTPLLPAGELSRRVGARVVLKAENLQITGSFKPRGATNRIARLSKQEVKAGVVAASAGNHAQAVAFAARQIGARATLVMPAGAPLAKVAAVRQYGGEVRLVDGSYDDVGLVVVPLGGGGLASGIGLALAARLPSARVVGVQAEACAPYPASIAAHRPVGARSANTICDGIAIKRPGDITLPLVERYVDEVVTVTDDQVAEAMVLLLERSKLVVEGAGAAAVAALMHGRVDVGDVEHLRDGIELHVRETAIKLVLQTRGAESNRELLDATRGERFSVSVET